MNLIIDLDTLSVTGTNPATIVRRKTVLLNVQFTKAGEVKALASDYVGHYALKVAGVLVSGGLSSAWEKSGYGTSTVYTFPLNADTTPLDDLFTGSPAPESVPAILTIDWSSASHGTNAESKPVIAEILNANLLGTEGTPAAIPDLKASQAEAEAGTDNSKWMTPERTAQAIAAKSISEAPSDGQTYGRASGAWHVINPQNVTLPTITGTAVQFNTLTDANTDTWTGSPTSFLRQWQRGSGSSWANIGGATASTYTLVLADAGYQVRMIKSAINSVGQSLPFSEATPTATIAAYNLNAFALAKWPLGDDGTGNVDLTDHTSNANYLTNFSSVGLTTVGGISSPFFPKGENNHSLVIPSGLCDPASSAKSFNVWAFFDALPTGYQWIWCQGSPQNIVAWVLISDAPDFGSNGAFVELDAASGWAGGGIYQSTLPLAQWVMLTLSFDGVGTKKLHLNGGSANGGTTVTGSYAPPLSGGESYHLGAYPSLGGYPNTANMNLSHVSVYSKEVSDADLATLWNSGTPA